MVILIIVCGLMAFILYTSKFKNPYKLFFVFGKKGSGKSTYLVKQAVRYQKKGFKIYTNMADMMLPGVRFINIDDLGRFVPEKESVLLLDEVGMVWDSRNFKNFREDVRDFFKLQRHYHCICFLASQTWDIDKKLRDLCDSFYLCTNFMNVFSLVRPIRRMVFLTEADSSSESRIADNLKFEPIFSWSLTYIPNFRHFFDSFDVPDMPHLNYMPVNPDLAPEILKPFKFSDLKYCPRHTKHAFPFRRYPSFYRWFENTKFVKLFDSLVVKAYQTTTIEEGDELIFLIEFTLVLCLCCFVIISICAFFGLRSEVHSAFFSMRFFK